MEEEVRRVKMRLIVLGFMIASLGREKGLSGWGREWDVYSNKTCDLGFGNLLMNRGKYLQGKERVEVLYSLTITSRYALPSQKNI